MGKGIDLRLSWLLVLASLAIGGEGIGNKVLDEVGFDRDGVGDGSEGAKRSSSFFGILLGEGLGDCTKTSSRSPTVELDNLLDDPSFLSPEPTLVVLLVEEVVLINLAGEVFVVTSSKRSF